VEHLSVLVVVVVLMYQAVEQRQLIQALEAAAERVVMRVELIMVEMVEVGLDI
jgi:hypothetical protein